MNTLLIEVVSQVKLDLFSLLQAQQLDLEIFGDLLLYVIFSLTFGFTLMVAEIGIGRKTRLSAIGAFDKLKAEYSFVGVLASLVPIIITPYYAVIGGWVLKFLWSYISLPAAEGRLEII